MRLATLTTAFFAAAAMSACAPALDAVVDETREWRGTLDATAEGDIRAAATANSTPAGTAVAVSIADAPTGGTHAWHVHRGTCANPGEVVGDPQAYPALRPDAGGSANARAVLTRRPLMRGQDYIVGIHQGATVDTPVIACVNLQ